MLSGKQFRLKADTIAIETHGDGRRAAITIPSGATVRILSGPRPDDRRMVDALWERRTVVMFAEDIQTRGEEVNAAHSDLS
jgi:hypothetical protein